MFDKIKKFFNKSSAIHSEIDNTHYLSCKHLHGGITFMHHDFRACCSNKGGITFVENYKGEDIDWKKVALQRKEVIENCKKGILPQNCIGCVDLETKDWSEHNLIDNIYINHWDHCNAACIYCVSLSHAQFLQGSPKPSRYYSVYKHLEELYKNKMISPNVHVELIGGDLAVLDEAEDIINLVIDNGVGEMSFHSSCISYSKGIERAMKEVPLVSLDFSIDCGNRELYKRIKRIDAFDKVKDNLKRYMNSSENAVNDMIAKYIIVDGYNDNIEVLDEWINFINEIGIKYAKVDVNFQRFFPEFHHPDPSVPKHYYDLYAHYKKRIEELGIEDRCWEFSRRVMEEGGIPKSYLVTK